MDLEQARSLALILHDLPLGATPIIRESSDGYVVNIILNGRLIELNWSDEKIYI